MKLPTRPSAVRGRFASAGLIVLAFGILGGGCSPKPGCLWSGDGGLFVPESRVSAIAEIRVSAGGDPRSRTPPPKVTQCEVFAPVVDCDAGGCREWGDAGFGQFYRVTARQPGTCTVTVAFTDGCAPEVFEFEFGGPLNNCCSEACARGGGEAVSPGCEIDAGP